MNLTESSETIDNPIMSKTTTTLNDGSPNGLAIPNAIDSLTNNTKLMLETLMI